MIHTLLDKRLNKSAVRLMMGLAMVTSTVRMPLQVTPTLVVLTRITLVFIAIKWVARHIRVAQDVELRGLLYLNSNGPVILRRHGQVCSSYIDVLWNVVADYISFLDVMSSNAYATAMNSMPTSNKRLRGEDDDSDYKPEADMETQKRRKSGRGDNSIASYEQVSRPRATANPRGLR